MKSSFESYLPSKLDTKSYDMKRQERPMKSLFESYLPSKIDTKSYDMRRQEGPMKSLFESYLASKRSRRIRIWERDHSYIHWEIAQCYVTLSSLSSDSWFTSFQNVEGHWISSDLDRKDIIHGNVLQFSSTSCFSGLQLRHVAFNQMNQYSIVIRRLLKEKSKLTQHSFR